VGEERLVVVSAPFEDGLNGRKLIVGARASHSGTPLMSPPVLSKVGVTDSDWTGLRGRLLRGLWT
jgi:hypothetical protein